MTEGRRAPGAALGLATGLLVVLGLSSPAAAANGGADGAPPVPVPSAVALARASCAHAFSFGRSGSLFKRTQPPGGPANNKNPASLPIVTPGETITATLTWNTGDFSGRTSRAEDCVQINGVDRPGLAAVRTPGPVPIPGTTEVQMTYTVPVGAVDGMTVCDRGQVSGTPVGNNPSTEKSNRVCFVVGPPAQTPEFGWPLGAGLAAIALLGGYAVR